MVVPIVATAIGLILLALWWGYRRTRSRVGGRIKEVRSKAVDVMDHLDALKERLKLLPTSPEFKEPMAGETEAFYRSVKEKNDTLWDGWLQIMEVLDKAQKLADRSGSLFSKTALNDAEKLIEQKGSFKEIERQSQETAAGVDRLDKAHAAARAVLDAIDSARPKLGTAARGRHQARPAHQALPGRARFASPKLQPGRCPDDRRPDGNTEACWKRFAGNPTCF